MRLFVALLLNRQAEERLFATVERLRAGSTRGSFTRRENLHLTLAFLGETGRVREAEAAVRAMRGQPFSLVLEGIGRFRRAEGDLYWLGATPSAALTGLHSQLCRELAAQGFAVESRPFRPHLTLGRRVAVAPEFDRERLSRETGTITSWTDEVALMRSERVGGVLTYTPVLRHHLEGFE